MSRSLTTPESYSGRHQKQKLLDVVHDDTDTDQTDLDDEQNDKTNHGGKRCCWLTCGVITAILAIQLTFVPDLLTRALRDDITRVFVFTKPDPENDHYQEWLTNSPSGSSVPIVFSIQFFNLTNPDDVLRGAMPKLNLTRPIVYNQYYY
eukprot:144379_1